MLIWPPRTHTHTDNICYLATKFFTVCFTSTVIITTGVSKHGKVIGPQLFQLYPHPIPAQLFMSQITQHGLIQVLNDSVYLPRKEITRYECGKNLEGNLLQDLNMGKELHEL